MKTLEILLQSPQGMVFCIIALVSFVFIILGSFGGGHDHGEVGHDHVAGDHDGSAHEFTTVSFFSIKVLSIFFLAFGAGGIIATAYGRGPAASTGIGLVCGVIVGFIALYAMRALYSQQANSLVTNQDIEGKVGQVVTRIPYDGIGEVSFLAAGQLVTRLARSKDRTELTNGKRVKIVSVSGDALLVEPVQ
ncbi:MAG: NfeD family protein [bacterium]|nr:NfeD family protein [bacterium]